jgi:hypothetical protein
MQLLRLFTIGLCAAIGANADCWKSGPSTSAGNIEQHLDLICLALESQGYLKGEQRYICVLDDIGVKWEFSLKVSPAHNDMAD